MKTRNSRDGGGWWSGQHETEGLRVLILKALPPPPEIGGESALRARPPPPAAAAF